MVDWKKEGKTNPFSITYLCQLDHIRNEQEQTAQHKIYSIHRSTMPNKLSFHGLVITTSCLT